MRQRLMPSGFNLILLVWLAACTSTTPHQNFKNFMNANVGRNAEDPRASIKRYSAKVAGKTQLPNGNTEVKYQAAYAGCIVYFEVDAKTNIIVGWRFEGDEKVCAIVP
jgi:hypothetical protein